MNSTLIIAAIIVWFFCGLAAATIAENKGNSSGAAFIVGVLFGPLGILFAAVDKPNEEFIRNRQTMAMEKQVEQGTLKRCPFCLGYIPPAAIACQHCGRDVNTKPVAVAAPSVAPPATNNRCSSCGATNPPEYKFCGVCGTPLFKPSANS